ncbi:MAG: DUF4316 domain-containing protein [Clostridium sp.]|nr:DUF4316 domain-containing protein [Clostridium sp.]
MPIKDKIQSENEEEKHRKSAQNISEIKPQKLLPFLNLKAEFHQNRIDTLDEKIAARQDKIARHEAKIEKLSAKADKLEDKNKVLKATLGNLPGIKQIIEANERKIKAIREEKIPKRQQKCTAHKNRIEKLSQKKNIISHKLDRVTALNNVIRSFSIGHNKERREVFSNAMDKLNQASVKCLNDKKNALETRKSNLLLTYSLPETSAVDKINMQGKISDVNGRIEALENKIHKIARHEKFYAEQPNEMVDAAMKVTEDKLTEMSEKDKLSVPDISENVVSEVQSLEGMDKSEISHIAENYLKNTEMALEDDYNSIDGIINNGSKEEVKNADSSKINPDYYRSLPKESRHIEVMTARQADKVMDKLASAWIAFSAVKRIENKTAVTVDKSDSDALKNAMKEAFTEAEQESKAAWRQLGDAYVEAYEERKIPDKKPLVKTINSDYYRSLAKENRSISVETAEVGKKVMEQLEDKDIQYSASIRKNNSVAITVSKADSQAYKNISDSVKNARAVQNVNPNFYRSLPKEERFTQRMPQKQAEEKITELTQKGIPHSAVLNGEKSAVTVEKNNNQAVYISRDVLKRQAQRISRKGKENSQAKTKNQGLEQG